jgi:hypothetical protein
MRFSRTPALHRKPARDGGKFVAIYRINRLRSAFLARSPMRDST